MLDGKAKEIPIKPKQIISFLLFLILATKPNISYAVIELARFALNSSKNHIIIVKNLLKYLKIY
ncbi:hypothetical protein BUE80_DR013943 [Diplocarpon rosae]|nr:hypothetical protein BUE80_DR013943 [Diplocarpon rosae]